MYRVKINQMKPNKVLKVLYTKDYLRYTLFNTAYCYAKETEWSVAPCEPSHQADRGKAQNKMKYEYFQVFQLA